jgi:UDP-GlcNAc:undecaprenyl-phosphate/decaprenyl-phosphate GlcNAc-1-phosphate transferase
LGGLSYLIPLLILLIAQGGFDLKIIGMAIGLAILMFIGALDDRYELPAKTQFIVQILAAAVVVFFGVRIIDINIASLNLNFDWWHTFFDIGGTQFGIVLPADLITIFWILLIINAVNWMYGMDAIGEVMTIIASITTALLSVKAGLFGYAGISFALAGGLLGFLPFNLFPSKIIGGTAGATGNGFLLAVLSILSGAKFNNAIMLLMFPLFDMIWVVIYRIRTHVDEPFLKRPFISGKVHFHHRLMRLGFSQRKILFIETCLITAISIFGLVMSGFSNMFLFLVITLGVLVIIFTFVSLSVRRKEKKLISEIKQNVEDNAKEETVKKDDIPPEQRYAY